MPNINVLDSSIYNRISAGEVVERPRSVVKELVENAIDAGATIINISIEGGGIKSIIVSDNGCGIDRDNVKKAFLPHATSKIACIDDLEKISTLGFRGEALASIAAVAQVTIKSKTSDADGATLLEINGGEFGELSECALNVGTTIEVKNLFYNTPVRAKFLKKPKSEENEITASVKEFILTNPEIVFVYKVDGKTIYQNSGISMEDALYAVYPKEIVDNFIAFDTMVHGIRVYGYVASPEVSKPTRAYQTIIVNGRFIKDASISAAVQNAFAERLMKRTFPVFIINLVIPFDEVDVNVHPNKAEVRFQDSRKVFGAVYRAIGEALAVGKTIFHVRQSIIDESIEKDNDLSSIVHKESTSEPTYYNDAVVPSNENTTSYSPSRVKSNYDESDNVSVVSELTTDSCTSDNAIDSENKDDEPITFESLTGNRKIYDNGSFNRVHRSSRPSMVEESKSSPFITKRPQCEQFSFIDESLEEETNKLVLKDYRIVGQIFNTFLLVEYKGDVLLMDQHACAERINYDKLVAEVEKNAVVKQQLLLPYILKVSPEDDSFIRDNLDNLASMGFDVSEFREFQYRVDSVPRVLGDINLEIFFNEFLSEKSKIRQMKFTELIKDKLATTACKASIKAGNILSSEQIKMLLDVFTEKEIPLQCPHGRPAVIRITRKDIDKLFKRIV